VCVRLRRGCLFRGGDLGTQPLQLLVDRRMVGEKHGQLFVALAELTLEPLQLLLRLFRSR
jgi:hypothetical protein